MIGDYVLAWFLGGLFGKPDDGVEDRLAFAVAEHDGTEHDFFGKLPGFGFNHQHRVTGTGDDQVKVGLFHVVDGRVQHVFAVDIADARAGDRAHERHPGKRQGGRCRDKGDNVGIVFHVVRQDSQDDLGFVLVSIGEQRTDRPVDQARRQGFVFRRAAFAFEKAAGDLAGGIGFFLVVDRQREEIEARFRILGRHDGGQNGCFAVRAHDGAVGLAGDLPGFKCQGPSAPLYRFCLFVKHGCPLDVANQRKGHGQDNEPLFMPRKAFCNPAPWLAFVRV